MKDLKKFQIEKPKPVNENIESTVRRYAIVKEQLDELEQEKKRLNDAIKMHLAHIGENQTEVAGFSVSMSECTRENFSLVRAADALTARQYTDYVSPFVTETQYTQLRVKRGSK